jgi:hypothetical protein
MLTCNPSAGTGEEPVHQSGLFRLPTSVGQNGPTVLPAIYGPAFFNSDLGLFKNFQFKESRKLQLRFNATTS